MFEFTKCQVGTICVKFVLNSLYYPNSLYYFSYIVVICKLLCFKFILLFWHLTTLLPLFVFIHTFVIFTSKSTFVYLRDGHEAHDPACVLILVLTRKLVKFICTTFTTDFILAIIDYIYVYVRVCLLRYIGTCVNI